MATVTNDLDSVSDTELVERSQTGDQEAYGLVVKRYQSLVCSVAYNRCGDLALSEDLAQDAFLQAWKKLSDLRDTADFRSWICVIVRNLTARATKRDRSVRHSNLDLADNLEAETESPDQQAVTAEEETLVWQALEEIPESYREPMILFYREEQSVARVARGLGLTEDAVKQRLSRGRKMLHQRLADTVESTLTRSRPSKTFTTSVITGIAGLVPNSATATGVSSAKTVVAAGVAKASVAKVVKTGLIGGVVTGLGVILVSLLAQTPFLIWMFRESDKSIALLSDEECDLMDQTSFHRRWGPVLKIGIFFAAGAISYWLSNKWENLFAGSLIFFTLVMAGELPMFLHDWRLLRRMHQLRVNAGTYTPPGPLVNSTNSRIVVWKTLLLIAAGGYLIITWPILLMIYHSDWSTVPVVFAASTAISVIAWLIAIRFPARSAQACGLSFPVETLLGLTTTIARRSTWSQDITDFGLFFAAMSGMAMTMAVLLMLVSRRMEESSLKPRAE